MPKHNGQPNDPSPYWMSGLCDCCDNIGICCVTIVCPCVTFGRIANISSQGSSSCCVAGTVYICLGVCFMCCLYSCCFRTKLRRFFGLPASPCCDCLVHFFCEPFALCQEYRELHNRGFDLSAGWKENIRRQHQMAPMINQKMFR